MALVAALAVPAAQALHAVPPVSYVPGPHAVHALIAVDMAGLDWPAGQLVHEPCPGEPWYVPATQLVHVFAPAPLYVPAPHVVHVEATVAAVALLAVPAVHFVHEDCCVIV